MQGRCRAAEEVVNNVLSRSVEEAAKQDRDAYRDDVPATEVGQLRSTRLNSTAISSTPVPPPQAHHAILKAKEKERLDVKRRKRGGGLGGIGC
jgi:hypothetical protein